MLIIEQKFLFCNLKRKLNQTITKGFEILLTKERLIPHGTLSKGLR